MKKKNIRRIKSLVTNKSYEALKIKNSRQNDYEHIKRKNILGGFVGDM